MQKKLRQGFGRAIRTEQDSCVVAILDERAGIGGKYHDAALAALPTCPTTEKIEDVQPFIREQKLFATMSSDELKKWQPRSKNSFLWLPF